MVVGIDLQIDVQDLKEDEQLILLTNVVELEKWKNAQ